MRQVMVEPVAAQKNTPLLSIVIIARNQADYIPAPVESALREAQHYAGTEIVLVDSASTDATIEIARRYPIGVIRLRKDWFLSAAAGRHIGYRSTRGQFILHLDGDMTLCAGWLVQAVPYMLANPQVAGCCGYWENIFPRAGQTQSERANFDPAGKIRRVNEFGGAALYRRSALQQVGGFNPYIYSNEEPELGVRLRHAGFELVYLPHQIVEHHSLPEHSLANYWRRRKSHMWHGTGQILRQHLGKDTFAEITQLASARYLLATTVGLLGILGLLLLGIIFASAFPILLALGGGAAFVGLVVLRKRNVHSALLSIVLRLLIFISSVEGFLMPPHNAADYPTNVEIIQPIPEHSNRVSQELSITLSYPE